MTLAEYIAEFRRVRDDLEEDHLWSDDAVVSFLNDAVNEACERAKLIEDGTTEEVCVLNIEAGLADYTLHESVFEIKRLAINGRRLEETSEEELDAECPGWETRTGEPGQFIRLGEHGLRFDRLPAASGEARLTVYRLPLTPLLLANKKAEPELPRRYHERLMPWLHARALRTVDSEGYDPVRAREYEDEFEANFGKRMDANVQRKHRDKRPPVVQMGTW